MITQHPLHVLTLNTLTKQPTVLNYSIADKVRLLPYQFTCFEKIQADTAMLISKITHTPPPL